MRDYRPEEIVIEADLEESPIVRNVRRAFPTVPVTFVDDGAVLRSRLMASEDPLGEGKKRIFLTRNRGEFLKKCPGSDGQVCCNYFVINFLMTLR
jgi:spore photoproduct lyase